MRELSRDEKIIHDMIKRKCNVTWNDSDTNESILEIMEDAMLAIQNKLGFASERIPDIFIEPGPIRSLLKNLALYMRNNCEEDFDGRYLNEIMQARRPFELMAAEKQVQNEAEGTADEQED